MFLKELDLSKCRIQGYFSKRWIERPDRRNNVSPYIDVHVHSGCTHFTDLSFDYDLDGKCP
jgi:hypothetical protein